MREGTQNKKGQAVKSLAVTIMKRAKICYQLVALAISKPCLTLYQRPNLINKLETGRDLEITESIIKILDPKISQR
jgi:hypothetical protein